MAQRDIIDLPEWRMLSQSIVNQSGSTGIQNTAGIWIAEDFRNRNYSHPYYYCNTLTAMYSYSTKFDAWATNESSVGMGGTMGSGATSVFCPTFSPMGTLAAGGSTTKIILTTALPASVNINQLANRGDGLGFIVRIIGNSAGGSGKIEERRVLSNTSGTTPTIILDSPLSFTPAVGDRYEFLSGSHLMLSTGALTANQFRRYDILTKSFSSLSTTSLIATVPATCNQLIALDEQYVPSDRLVGEGYIVGAGTYDTLSTSWVKKCLTATASAAGTLTGQAASGDAVLVVNQFRNHQIRIVEDTAIPTAVGQRRRITSHTVGASPVYTLATNWTVTPSATCKFVIENDTDRIIGLMGGTTTIYNYFISNLGNTAATANTWDTTSWGARGGNLVAGGFSLHGFGISPLTDSTNVIKSTNIVSFRGVSQLIDILDIAGGATGSWSSITNTFYSAESFTTNTDIATYAYNPHTENGKYMYFINTANISSSQFSYKRFDIISNTVETIAGAKIGAGLTTTNMGKQSFVVLSHDALNTVKVAFYNTPRRANGTDFLQLMILK